MRAFLQSMSGTFSPAGKGATEKVPDTFSPPPLIASNQIADYLGRMVRVEGLVAAARRVHTKDGRLLQFITLEDEQGLTETTLFPDECPAVPYLTMGPYTATGVVEEQYGVYTLTARKLSGDSTQGNRSDTGIIATVRPSRTSGTAPETSKS